jgi:hypothetical protein
LNLAELKGSNRKLLSLIERGDKLYLRANRSDKSSGESIKDKNSTAREASRNVDAIIEETSKFRLKIEEEQKIFLAEIINLKARLEILKSENNKIIEILDRAALLRNIAMIIITSVAILGLLGFTWYQSRKVLLEGMAKLENAGSVVDKLIPYIQDSRKSPIIRFHAIRILYDTLYSPDQTQVDLIKETVKTLAKSSSDTDVKVAAELRKLALDLESRSSESRRIS